jgi:hypothetical protein
MTPEIKSVKISLNTNCTINAHNSNTIPLKSCNTSHNLFHYKSYENNIWRPQFEEQQQNPRTCYPDGHVLWKCRMWFLEGLKYRCTCMKFYINMWTKINWTHGKGYLRRCCPLIKLWISLPHMKHVSSFLLPLSCTSWMHSTPHTSYVKSSSLFSYNLLLTIASTYSVPFRVSD